MIECEQAIRDPQHLAVVRHHEESPAGATRQPVEQLDHAEAGFEVEVPGRFVREDEIGLVDQGSRHGDPLLFAPGQAIRKFACAVGEPDLGEQCPRARTAPAVESSQELERKTEVLFDGQRGDQVEELEDEPEPCAPQSSALGVGETSEVVAVEHDTSGVRRVEPCDEVEKSRLAAAAAADEHDHLSGVEAQRSAVEDRTRSSPLAIALADGFENDERGPAGERHDHCTLRGIPVSGSGHRDRICAMTNEATPGLASDLLELAKPRITALVTLTTAAGFAVATPYGEFPWAAFLYAAAGTALVSGGSAAFNQVLERELDARMRRTARRPLPAGRRPPWVAVAWGALLSLSGLLVLALRANLLTAGVALATLVVYDLVYTPMKTRTAFATVVGAVPGAAPPVIGWTAATGELGLGAWLLFALLFLWQLPHFLSIAWLYREDYRRAGMHLLTIDDPDSRRTARQTVVWTLALLPISTMPAAVGLGGPLYLAGAFVTGLAFLAAAIAFARAPRVESARRLLLTSVAYLPAVLGTMVVDHWWVV